MRTPAPDLSKAAYVDPSALLFGSVTVSEGASIWPYVVVRGESDGRLDDNDTIEGQAGRDELLFNGANVAENIDISANGGRVRVDRTRAACP